eukprot:Awhi_evm1s1191
MEDNTPSSSQQTQQPPIKQKFNGLEYNRLKQAYKKQTGIRDFSINDPSVQDFIKNNPDTIEEIRNRPSKFPTNRREQTSNERINRLDEDMERMVENSRQRWLRGMEEEEAYNQIPISTPPKEEFDGRQLYLNNNLSGDGGGGGEEKEEKEECCKPDLCLMNDKLNYIRGQNDIIKALITGCNNLRQMDYQQKDLLNINKEFEDKISLLEGHIDKNDIKRKMDFNKVHNPELYQHYKKIYK